MTNKQKKDLKQALELLDTIKDIDALYERREEIENSPQMMDNIYIRKILNISRDTEHFSKEMRNSILDWYRTNLHDTLAIDRQRSEITKGMEYADIPEE